jgi:FkbM family methyltransferase
MQPATTIPIDHVSCINFEGTQVYYETREAIARWRVETLFDKEPDTLDWLRQLKPGETFIDIGANVGMYSMLAAKAKKLRVFAFEPESQNYALLNRNIHLNEIQDIATAFPIALSDQNKVDRLYLSEFTTGGSCHQFGAETDFRLKPVKSPFAQGCVSFTLDHLVAEGIIPMPDHIKIDVDGIEHLVLAGAQNVIQNPQLKSILIEINTNLPQHLAIIKAMEAAGFEYDPVQVDQYLRKEGAFRGCGNYIFWRRGTRSTKTTPRFNPKEILSHLIRRIQETNVILYPYPHFIMDNFFPEAFYQEIMAHRISNESFTGLGASGRASSDYTNRFILKLEAANIHNLPPQYSDFWAMIANILNSNELLITLASKYRDRLLADGRLADNKSINLMPENLLVRDHTNYAIGPHTDAPHRLLSMLVYLPKDASIKHLGTSVYVPKDPNFRCKGGPHHDFENFELVKTAPFLPNTAFCFLKTDNSFHGVAPITSENIERDSLCYIARIAG